MKFQTQEAFLPVLKTAAFYDQPAPTQGAAGPYYNPAQGKAQTHNDYLWKPKRPAGPVNPFGAPPDPYFPTGTEYAQHQPNPLTAGFMVPYYNPGPVDPFAPWQPKGTPSQPGLTPRQKFEQKYPAQPKPNPVSSDKMKELYNIGPGGKPQEIMGLGQPD